jgi:hypothetical protein
MRWRKVDTLFRYRIDLICSTFADRKRQDVKSALVHDANLEFAVDWRN